MTCGVSCGMLTLQLAGLLLGEAVLCGCEVKVALGAGECELWTCRIVVWTYL